MSSVDGDGVGRTRVRPGAALLRRLLLSEYLVLALTALYVAGDLAARAGDRRAPTTWRDILAAMMPLLIVADRPDFVLIVAGIDLSATSILAMSSVVGASVMTLDGGYLAGHRLGSRSLAGSSAFIAVGAADRRRSTAPAPPASTCRPSSSR